MVNPIEYNPTSNEIKVKRNIEFNVVFDGADYNLDEASKWSQTDFDCDKCFVEFILELI